MNMTEWERESETESKREIYEKEKMREKTFS